MAMCMEMIDEQCAAISVLLLNRRLWENLGGIILWDGITLEETNVDKE